MQNPDRLITSYPTDYFLRIVFIWWIVWLCGWSLARWYLGWGFKSRKRWDLHIIFISVLYNVEYSRLVHNKHEVSFLNLFWLIIEFIRRYISKKSIRYEGFELKSLGNFRYHHIRFYRWANSSLITLPISMMLIKSGIYQ